MYQPNQDNLNLGYLGIKPKRKKVEFPNDWAMRTIGPYLHRSRAAKAERNSWHRKAHVSCPIREKAFADISLRAARYLQKLPPNQIQLKMKQKEA